MQNNTLIPCSLNGDTSGATTGNEALSLASPQSQTSGVRRINMARTQSPTQHPQTTSCPRFMSFEHAQGIKVPAYRPRVERKVLPFPTIDGGAVPTRYSARMEVKGPDFKPKLSKVLNRQGLKKKWKSTVKRFDNVNIMDRLDKCVLAMRKGYHHQALGEIKYKPVYRLKEVRRASVMVGSPRTVVPPSPFAESIGDNDTRTSEQADAPETSTPKHKLLEPPKSPRLSSSRYSGRTVDESRCSHELAVNVEEDHRISIGDLPVLVQSLRTEAEREPTTTTAQTPVTACPLPQPTSFHLHSLPRASWNSNFIDDDSPHASSSLSIFSPARRIFESSHSSVTKGSSLSDSHGCESDIHCCDGADQALAEYKQALISYYDNKEESFSDASSKTDYGRLYEDPMPSDSVMGSEKSAHDEESVASSVEEQTHARRKETRNDELDIADNERLMSLPRLRAREDRRQSRIPRASPPKLSAPSTENQDKVSPRPVRATPQVCSAIPVLARPGQIAQTWNSEKNVSSESVADATDRSPDDNPGDAGAFSTAATATDNENQSDDSDDEISSWDFNDNDFDRKERPCTVFTGEFRTKNLPRGPTLRVATSAEHIIMGAEDPKVSTSIVTKRSPSRVRYVMGKSKDASSEVGGRDPNHAVSEECDHIQTTRENEPDGKIVSNGMGSPGPSLKHSPCSVHSRDQENSVTIITPSPEHKPENCEDNAQTNTRTGETGKPIVSQTPTKETTPYSERSPATVVMPSSVATVPAENENQPVTRNGDEPGHDVRATANLEKTNKSLEPNVGRRNENNEERHNQTETIPSESRLPESKSSRMLVGFRSIFPKNWCASTERSGAKQDGTSPKFTSKERPSVDDNDVDGISNTEMQIFKAKGKIPKFHGADSWNRGPRKTNPFAPAPKQQSEARISSFARPALSVITKAAGSSRREPDVDADANANKKSIPHFSGSGYPQYPIRPRRNSSVSISSPFYGHPPLTTPSGSNMLVTDSEKLRCIRIAIDEFCHRARDARTTDGRERSIKIALSLQQALGDYKIKAKEFKDAERTYFRKRLSRDIERSTLFEFYEQAQSYLHELREE